SLDDLYNIGGTGANNQLIAGISTSGATVSFGLSCEATVDSQPFKIPGMVMADAEAINKNTSGSNTEFVSATGKGNWHIVEMKTNVGAGSYMAVKTAEDDGRQTIRFGPGT